MSNQFYTVNIFNEIGLILNLKLAYLLYIIVQIPLIK